MKSNMSNVDRLIRIIAALTIGLLYYIGLINGVVATILGILAVVLIITSLIGFCPLYWPFNISTRKKD